MNTVVAAPARLSAATPLLPEIGVIALVPDTWGGPWMPRHHVVTRLGRLFNVVWLDPAREWRDWWPRAKPRRFVLDDSVPAIPGFRLYRPGRWLPRFYRPEGLARATETARLLWARHLLGTRGARLLALYLWRPEFETSLDRLRHDFSCYHIDDEYSFSTVERPTSEAEARLMRRVDQVVIHSPGLAEKKGTLNPRTLVVPNGTDFDAFRTPRDEPGDLAAIPHPRIGYVGVIKPQLDIALMAGLAARHPTWSFVFVGPVRVPAGSDAQQALQALRALPNAHFLGARPAGTLPGYMQHVDVCAMPYVMDGYTPYIYPMKLHEYLATGRPVVGRPIRALRDFEHVVQLATTVEEWSAALAAALEPAASSGALQARRRAVARAHDWDTLTRRIGRVFVEHLAPGSLARFDAVSAETESRIGPV